MKKLILYTGLLYGGWKLFIKKQQIEELKDKLRIRPQNVRNVKIVSGGVKMLIDINLINESNLDFSLNSLGAIKLKRINFFTANGTQIGTAFPNITNIAISPNSNMLLQNVEAVIGAANITTVLNQLITGYQDIYTTSEIEILGVNYTI